MAGFSVMLFFASVVSQFIEQHPTLKLLALFFVLSIGIMLVADGIRQHMNPGYISFAMAFSLTVEVLNILSRRKRTLARHATENLSAMDVFSKGKDS